MYHFIMDPDRGKKWFTFYTRIRPWFAVALAGVSVFCLFVILVVPDYFTYPFWAFLGHSLRIVHAAFCVVIFAKSFGDYFDLVRHIKGLLIFEMIYYPLTNVIDQMVSGESLIVALFIGVIVAVPFYFLWYRLNFKYFDSRLICTNPPSKEEAEHYIQNKAAAKANKEQQEYSVKTAEELLKEYSAQANKEEPAPTKTIPSHICLSYDDPKAPNPNEGMLFQPQTNKDDTLDLEYVEFDYDEDDEDDDEIEEVKTPNFCHKCGNKLAPDSIFCSNCGTKVQ